MDVIWPPRSRAAPELAQFTGYLLRRAFVKVVGVAHACVTESEQLRDALVLAVLDQHGVMSQRHLSDVTGIHENLVVKLVDGLESRDWVVRERNPTDRRSNALRLTESGGSALQRLNEQLDRADDDLVKALTTAEVATLRRLLGRLLDGDPARELPVVSDRVGFLVARAHRLMRASAEEALAPLGLHPRDFGVLSLLARDQPCSQRHLAHQLGITPPAVLAFVEELEAAGLVCRTRNAQDRRSYDLTLSERGRKRLSEAVRVAGNVQEEAVRRLGREGDAQLRSLLSKLVTIESEGRVAPTGNPRPPQAL
jgi:DNA-binding MarR family transcriptional regulator